MGGFFRLPLGMEDLKIASKARVAYYYESKAVKKGSDEGLEVLHNSFAIC